MIKPQIDRPPFAATVAATIYTAIRGRPSLPSIGFKDQRLFTTTTRKQRGTVDMVFAIRQLQEKCVEQQQDLHLLFINLTKAFDTVNRAALWAILSKLGCPPQFVQIIRSFHDGMFCSVIENGDASDPFPVSNGVKQGCILAPTLFSLIFTQMLSVVLSQTEAGV